MQNMFPLVLFSRSDGQEKISHSHSNWFPPHLYTRLQAKKVADAEDSSSPQAEARLRKEFEGLLTILKPDSAVKKDDIEKIKKELLNPVTTFYVTEVRPLEDLTGGYLIRGTLPFP